jgi:hypothetical protein
MFVEVENVTGEDLQRYVTCEWAYVEELRISYHRIWECKVAIENVTRDELLKYVAVVAQDVRGMGCYWVYYIILRQIWITITDSERSQQRSDPDKDGLINITGPYVTGCRQNIVALPRVLSKMV